LISTTSRPALAHQGAQVLGQGQPAAAQGHDGGGDLHPLVLVDLVLGLVAELGDEVQGGELGVPLQSVDEALLGDDVLRARGHLLEQLAGLVEEGQEPGAVAGEALEHRQQLPLLGVLLGQLQLLGDVVDHHQQAAVAPAVADGEIGDLVLALAVQQARGELGQTQLLGQHAVLEGFVAQLEGLGEAAVDGIHVLAEGRPGRVGAEPAVEDGRVLGGQTPVGGSGRRAPR
jgi:hypothetical protein